MFNVTKEVEFIFERTYNILTKSDIKNKKSMTRSFYNFLNTVRAIHSCSLTWISAYKTAA